MIATTGSTLTPAALRVPQRDRDWLHLVDELRKQAKRVVGEVFPRRGLKRFRYLSWFPYHGLSRARNGDSSCPLWRLAVWIVALRALGSGREVAQLLVDFLQGLIDLLYPVTEIDLISASQEEQRWEGVETQMQLQVMLDLQRGDLSRVPEYLLAARREHAAQDVVIRALEAMLAAAAINPRAAAVK